MSRFRQWIRSVWPPRPMGRPNRNQRFIPKMEVLEDRTAPATLTVTSLADNGTAGTLRYEIARANAGDEIEFKAGLAGTIVLNPSQGPLGITEPISIIGPDTSAIEISGSNQIRDIQVGNTSGQVILENLTITGGSASSGSGGGIYQNNNSGATLSLYNCTIAGNRTTSGGGGIAMGDGVVKLYDCTVYGNLSGSAGGGGIREGNGGNLTLVNCTIAGNETSGPGGGVLFAAGTSSDTVTMYNTIVAADVEAAGSVSGLQGDVDQESAKLSSTVSNDLIGNGQAWAGVKNGQNSCIVGTTADPVNPLLGPLQNNGGPTPTLGLVPGSPALDKGSAALALGPNTDQRGQGYPRVIKGTCDIGAIEEGSNAVYVGNLYELLLDRPADSGSIAWINMLQAGAPPTTIVLDIEQSNEYLTDRVIGFYHQFLNRNPAPAEVQYWVGQLASGVSIPTVEADFCASPEYLADHQNNNLDFVYALYQDILGRTPSSQEAQQWINQLNAGVSRLQVALDFFSSNEYLTDYVTAVYEQFLHRAPDSVGLAAWVPALASGMSEQQFVADVIGSPEGLADYS